MRGCTVATLFSTKKHLTIPDTHPNVIFTSLTPDVIWHLKPDDEYAHVQFPSSLSQSMSAKELVEPSCFGIIIRRVVLVGTFSFAHLGCKLLICESVIEMISLDLYKYTIQIS